MRCHEESRISPYTAEQLFDLVVRIEHYPAFIPGYLHARLERREANILYVTQVISFDGFRWQFGSVATVQRPGRILVRSNDRPFRLLEIEWRFHGLPDGCRVVFSLSCEFASRILDLAIGPWFGVMIEPILSAFLKEAHRLYGRPS